MGINVISKETFVTSTDICLRVFCERRPTSSSTCKLRGSVAQKVPFYKSESWKFCDIFLRLWWTWQLSVLSSENGKSTSVRFYEFEKYGTLSQLLFKISLATKQLILWEKATIAATFGAFLDDCWDTNTDNSVAEILRNKSLSVIVNCCAKVVELKSHAVKRTSVLSRRFKYWRDVSLDVFSWSGDIKQHKAIRN